MSGVETDLATEISYNERHATVCQLLPHLRLRINGERLTLKTKRRAKM